METNENLALASMRSRMTSFIIDDVIITFLVVFMMWDTMSAANDFLTVLQVMNGAFYQIVFLKFIYQTFFIWYYGQTIGKFVAKIRVIDFDNFGKVSLSSAMIRSAGRIISEAIMYLGFFVAYFTDSRQTFHDKIGKTLVVNV